MSDKTFGSSLRKNILLTLVAVIVIGFIGQLIKMQIVEHKSYDLKSDIIQ